MGLISLLAGEWIDSASDELILLLVDGLICLLVDWLLDWLARLLVGSFTGAWSIDWLVPYITCKVMGTILCSSTHFFWTLFVVYWDISLLKKETNKQQIRNGEVKGRIIEQWKMWQWFVHSLLDCELVYMILCNDVLLYFWCSRAVIFNLQFTQLVNVWYVLALIQFLFLTRSWTLFGLAYHHDHTLCK